MALPSSIALTTIADDSDIDASPHRNNYTAVQTAVNGLITYLGSFAGSTTYRKTTAKTVNTTVSATDLLNGEITVAASAMGTTGCLRLTAFGDWLQNSGGAAVLPRFQLVFGGTTLLDTGTPTATATASSSRVGWRIDVAILNTATGTQVSSFDLSIAAAVTAAAQTFFTTGSGAYSLPASGTGQAVGYNASSVDTTAPQALVLNVINGSANAAYETKLGGALVVIE